jgi:serine/threonine protein kinase
VISGERVKVLDFGIAKLVGDARSSGGKTRTDLAMGTPNYVSPEQCSSESAADARSDIYSLGCTWPRWRGATGRSAAERWKTSSLVTCTLRRRARTTSHPACPPSSRR